jgi:hypothetical protein
MVVDRPGVLGSRLGGVREHGERLQLDLDQLRRILGRVRGIGHDDGDRLTNEPDAPFGEHRPRQRHRTLVLARRSQRAEREVGGGEGTVHARRGCGRFEIQGAYLGVGERGPQETGM